MTDSLSALREEQVDEVGALIQNHLLSLSQGLHYYFPDLSDLDCRFIRNPLKMDSRTLPDDLQAKFVHLVNDSTARDAFESLSLTSFWSTMAMSYRALAKGMREKPSGVLFYLPL